MESMLSSLPKRTYSAEEKSQMLQNFDLEVESRRQQFVEWLADHLENFRLREEGRILHIPRLVRDITLRNFAKYNGNIQECLKGLQRERLGGEVESIDRTTRKRKWIESQETDAVTTNNTESERDSKSARIMASTPRKLEAAQRSRLPLTKTPGTLRTGHRPPIRHPSSSPRKPTLAGANGKPFAFPRLGTNSRPTSPVKPPASPSKPARPASPSKARVPSSSTFNPVIPETARMRWPRKDERMLSANGSPLANPYQLGFSFNFANWLASADGDDEGGTGDTSAPEKGHKRTNSILIRAMTGQSSNPSHIRSGSHATPSAAISTHSRTNSINSGFVPLRRTPSSEPQTPRHQPLPAALVAVPTRDGHILEFDPLQTSPDEIDALEGITDSAKKQAKEDIARLVLKAVERWKIP